MSLARLVLLSQMDVYEMYMYFLLIKLQLDIIFMLFVVSMADVIQCEIQILL